jgi:hypothetical protein
MCSVQAETCGWAESPLHIQQNHYQQIPLQAAPLHPKCSKFFFGGGGMVHREHVLKETVLQYFLSTFRRCWIDLGQERNQCLLLYVWKFGRVCVTTFPFDRVIRVTGILQIAFNSSQRTFVKTSRRGANATVHTVLNFSWKQCYFGTGS